MLFLVFVAFTSLLSASAESIKIAFFFGDKIGETKTFYTIPLEIENTRKEGAFNAEKAGGCLI